MSQTISKEDRSRLLRLTDFAGRTFGTEDFCMFLYSLVRMHGPETIVELGTGLGISAFWMALGAKRNGFGHVWTIDDYTLFEYRNTVLDEMTSFLRNELGPSSDIVSGMQYLEQMADFLDLHDFISFVKLRINLKEINNFEQYPFGDNSIDLLFSDFRHAPDDVLNILGHFLPKMSAASSIFIDSASTFLPSFLLLEWITNELNKGNVPQTLQDRSTADLRQVMFNRKIRLIHLTKVKKSDQNGCSWLKLEPIDIVPHPRTHMRGL